MTTTTATTDVSDTDSAVPCGVHRFEVYPASDRPDPRGERLSAEARSLGYAIEKSHATRIYLIQAHLTAKAQQRLADHLLADRVIDTWCAKVHPAPPTATSIEVHPLPGVMDPVAQSVAQAAADLLGIETDSICVSTGWRYDLLGKDASCAEEIAQKLLANPVVQGIHTTPYQPTQLPTGHAKAFAITHIPICQLDNIALEKLSRSAHLFLSLEEMCAVQAQFRALNREPTDIELETIAQTWSEHCVHKTLKSTIHYTPTSTTNNSPTSPNSADTQGFAIPGLDKAAEKQRPGHTFNDDGSVTIKNLLKSTVAAATHELIAQGLDWTLSVFVDNAGIIAFDEKHALCMKVETHNHPSAIEPYGGAATGIGGCIRDIIGTGLAAKPIANTDVFCVATPDIQAVPAGCIHPKRTLNEIVGGVRDYGNRMGIPTLNGTVWFDDRFVGNPLVFCGCVGIMPRDKIAGDAAPGDLIVALGGRTGRDGIHGATFSSAELTDTHADEFSHAVQIGNAIEEKRTLDAILRARDCANGPLFRSITDCGAGGFSSAVGEMGEKVGATVTLENAPLKYDGLSYTEIWISEAQERMVLAVPQKNLEKLSRICQEEHVELAVLGSFGTPKKELVLTYNSTEVGRLPMHFLHEGIPQPTRLATWNQTSPPAPPALPTHKTPSTHDALLTLLAHPNIASKHWIIKQYDHEVQGNTILKPLVGPAQQGPGDAAVIEPVPGSSQGVAIGCGLAIGMGDPALGGDPYLAAIAALDECVRNLVCVGADPDRIAILDNFCWPSCNKPENLGALVRAAEGCYDGAMAYRTPFISGKDSLNNQFTIPGDDTTAARTIEIPPTLLISGIGLVSDIAKSTTMDAKRAGNVLVLIQNDENESSCQAPSSACSQKLGGSCYAQVFGIGSNQSPDMPTFDPVSGAMTARAVAAAIAAGLVRSAHDCSDGGLLVAVAEMLIAASTHVANAHTHTPDLGITLSNPANECTGWAFAESPGRFVLEVQPEQLDTLRSTMTKLAPNINITELGILDTSGQLRCKALGLEVAVPMLTAAWRGTLDW